MLHIALFTELPRETVWKSGMGTESGLRAPPNGGEGASTDRSVTPRMCTMVLPGYFPDSF